ncbi:MAG: stage II sporulation protein M [Bacteroidales bacterium]|nr:stage II sporulation protein M [Bacteroidales bacterium]
MKESRFIEQNKEKWSEFNQAFSSGQNDPGVLSKLFIQITDDLSFARTFYPNRAIRKYLNGITEHVFLNLNAPKKVRFPDFVDFWKTSLPLMNHSARLEFLISFLVFALAALIGYVSSANDSTFAAFILGEDYINLTLENIEKGNPVAIYESFVPIEGFFRITINNLMVAAYTFILGAFSAIGTIFILLYNGVMLGAFQEFFVGQGLFKISFLTIWQHGTIEISSIVIAGAAGLTMGKGLLFPGTYTRFQSFRMAAKRGLFIFVGIFPPIILAGFIESFITRHTELPDAVRISTIVVSLFAMLLYYVWYPARVASKNRTFAGFNEKIDQEEILDFDPGVVYTASQLFENTLVLIRSGLLKYLKAISILAIAGSLLTTYIVNREIDISSGVWLNPGLPDWPAYLNYSSNPVLYYLNSLGLAALLFVFIKPITKSTRAFQTSNKNLQSLKLISVSIGIGLMVNGFFYLGFWPAYLILIFLFPPLVMVASTFVNQKVNIFKALKFGFTYYFSDYFKGLELSFKFGILQIIFLILLEQFLFLFPEFVIPFFDIPYQHYYFYLTVLQGFLFYFVLFFGIGLIALSIGLLYFSSHEKLTSEGLLQRIDHFGESKKIFGYERE